jgi:hypothetical protein
MQNLIMDLKSESLMKKRQCVEIPLMAAFGAALAGRPKTSGKPLKGPSGNSTIGEFGPILLPTCLAFHLA